MENAKILRPEDLNNILLSEQKHLEQQITDPMERELFSWHAPWRQEALEHFLPLGWSFGVWQGEEGESELLGYFIAQPLLFFNGFTQSLWVEHVFSGGDNKLARFLVELAYRTSREKHIQKVIFNNYNHITEALEGYKVSPFTQDVVEINTTKI